MSKTFGQVAAELLAKINESDTRQLVQYRTSVREDEVITIFIPAKLEKSHDFNQTFLDLGQFPSRVFTDKKVKRKREKNWSSYISYIDQQGISSLSREELRDLLNKLDQDSVKLDQVAPFVYNLWLVWQDNPKEIRKHREVNTEIVRGYVKQRTKYTHREILDMVMTYIKWSKAYYAALKDTGDEKIIWFPRLNLQSLLLSNKMFPNHLEEGWKSLARSKRIPEEYFIDETVTTPEDQAKLAEQQQKVRENIITRMVDRWNEVGSFQDLEMYYQTPEIKEEVDRRLGRAS